MSGLALDHVQLLAPLDGAEEARRFYGGLLGLTEIERPSSLPGTSVWFACGSQEYHVGLVADFVPATKAHPGLRAESPETLDDFAARLAEAGYPVDWDELSPGHRRFFTRDPFGNRLELLADL